MGAYRGMGGYWNEYSTCSSSAEVIRDVIEPNQLEVRILILRYSQTKEVIILSVFCCFCHPSTVHISGTNCPFSVGFST